MFQVKFHNGIKQVKVLFNNEADSWAAIAMLNELSTRGEHSRVVSLMDWIPDDGDLLALRTFLPNQKVTAIKFARTKSGAGLKEAKDWIEENLDTLSGPRF
jgi:hypothetical protein